MKIGRQIGAWILSLSLASYQAHAGAPKDRDLPIKLSGTLEEIVFNPATKKAVATNLVEIDGVKKSTNFLITATPLKGARTVWTVGRENGITRSTALLVASNNVSLKTNKSAYVEAYLVPRMIEQRSTKIAVLSLIDDLEDVVEDAKLPLFLPIFPPYPLDKVTSLVESTNGSVRLSSYLKRDNKQTMTLWTLQVSRERSPSGDDLIIDHKAYDPEPGTTPADFPLIRTVRGTIALKPADSEPAYFRPALDAGEQFLDFTVIDQRQILSALDSSSKVAGSVRCKATNDHWECNSAETERQAPIVKRYVMNESTYQKGRQLTRSFWTIVSLLFLAPLAVLWMGRKRNPKRTK